MRLTLRSIGIMVALLCIVLAAYRAGAVDRVVWQYRRWDLERRIEKSSVRLRIERALRTRTIPGESFASGD